MALSMLDFLVHSVLFVILGILALFMLFLVALLFEELGGLSYRIFYVRWYKVFDSKPVFSFPHKYRNEWMHHLHITPYKAVFLIGIDYAVSGDSDEEHRYKTYWKEHFATHKEAQVELLSRYELLRVSPHDFPKNEYLIDTLKLVISDGEYSVVIPPDNQLNKK
jgi:hypothetical protein